MLAEEDLHDYSVKCLFVGSVQTMMCQMWQRDDNEYSKTHNLWHVAFKHDFEQVIGIDLNDFFQSFDFSMR